MKVEFHIKDVVVSENEQSLIEKKLLKLKRYLKDEPFLIDVYITDQAGAEMKGGVDKSVRLSADFQNEQVFVEEIDSITMRAFAFAYRRFERKLQEFHRKRIGKGKTIPNRLKEAFNFFFRKR